MALLAVCFFGSLFVVRLLAVASRQTVEELTLDVFLLWVGSFYLLVALLAVCFFGSLFVVRFLAVASRLWKHDFLVYIYVKRVGSFCSFVALVFLW